MKYIPLICSLLLLSACKIAKPISIAESKLDFTLPEGWEISDFSKEKLGSFVIVEKQGFDASGFISFAILDENQVDLDILMANSVESFSNNIILRNANLDFADPVNDEFRGIPSKKSSYTLSLLGVAHQGEIIVLINKGQTVIITKQGADEDYAVNEAGFQIIEESFRIKDSF